jgi:hypothetical protein
VITAKLLREWDACHDDDDIAALASGRTSASPREIASDDRITLDDRLWVVCRALWYRSESAARTFAIDSAALVSHLAGRPEDCAEHARLVADLRRIYAMPTEHRRSEELSRWAAARDAARAAAWDVAWDVARYAAWDVARDAAWAAAWAAARAAAWAAAWAAARDAAWDVAIRKAIDRALIALGPDADGWADAQTGAA